MLAKLIDDRGLVKVRHVFKLDEEMIHTVDNFDGACICGPKVVLEDKFGIPLDGVVVVHRWLGA